ncbi:MAG: glutaminyl-peptide cyclotransferase [Planctomycetes bacterium]|nr:glutaminyl-peptide cyclotransferase [Planctomycetota bacterium]
MRSLHLVVWIAVPAVLGFLLLLAVRMVPACEGLVGRVSPRAQGGRAGTHDLQPSAGNQAPPEVVHYRYKVIKTYPHDRRYFTQGLVYEDGFVYEGTGLYGQSALYKRDLQTGQTVKMLRLPDKYFGEGVTLFGDKLIQLTWQSRVGFVYTKDTFTPLREFKYRSEGWGLTHDGKGLILSDGTATLRSLDPNTFAETGRLEVRDQGRPVERLNELEYVADGPLVAQPPPAVESEESPPRAGVPQGPAGPRIYANIWPTDQIVIIDPATGRVTGWIDMSGLWTPPENEQGEAVLNGIAYLPQTKHLLVTGKLWPRMYEIELLSVLPQNQGSLAR